MKRIITILVVLVVVLLALSWWQRQSAVHQDIDLVIHSPQGMQGVQYQQLQALPQVQVSTNRGNTLSLVRLQDVFDALKISTQAIGSVEFRSEDGGTLLVDASEMAALYLQLNHSDKATYLRLVIPSDDFPQRWIKYITAITLSQ